MADTPDAIDDFFASGGESVPEGLTLPDPPEEATPEVVTEAKRPDPEPEPKPEAKPEPKPEDRRVPLAAVQEERQRRQAAEAREREMLALLKQLKGEPEKKPDDNAPPDPDDPIATIGWLRKQVEQTQSTLKQQRELTEQQRAIGELGNRVTAAENAYRKEKADYDDAADFTRGKLLEFYTLQGIPEPQAQQFLAEASVQMLRNLVQGGKDPAAAIYEMATKFGYQPKGAPPPAGEKPAGDDGLKKVEQKIDQLKRGMEAAKGKGGQGEDDTMTVEKLADLNGAAFDSAWDKMFGGEKRLF